MKKKTKDQLQKDSIKLEIGEAAARQRIMARQQTLAKSKADMQQPQAHEQETGINVADNGTDAFQNHEPDDAQIEENHEEEIQDQVLEQPQDADIEDFSAAVNDLKLNFDRVNSKCLCHPRLQQAMEDIQNNPVLEQIKKEGSKKGEKA